MAVGNVSTARFHAFLGTFALCGFSTLVTAAEPGKTVTFARDVAPIFQAPRQKKETQRKST